MKVNIYLEQMHFSPYFSKQGLWMIRWHLSHLIFTLSFFFSWLSTKPHILQIFPLDMTTSKFSSVQRWTETFEQTFKKKKVIEKVESYIDNLLNQDLKKITYGTKI